MFPPAPTACVRLIIALLLAAVGGAAVAEPAAYELVSTVGSDGGLEGCGVRVTRSDGGQATITLHRQDTRQGADPLELSATLPALTAPVDAVTLTTANAGPVGSFRVAPDAAASTLHATAAIDVDAAALMMRDVLLQGVKLSARTGNAAPIEAVFDGPAGADVIRGYLQCAGNMGR